MDSSFFTDNRKALLNKLQGGLVVISAYALQQRSGDAAYKFSQESNFWYLSGLEDPNWGIILDGTSGDEILVRPQIDEVHQIFEGGLTDEQASNISGIKRVITSNEAQSMLRKLAKKHSVAYTVDTPSHASYFNFSLNPSISVNKKMLERTFSSVVDCQKELAKLRAIKRPEEIKIIQQAIDITIEGFSAAKDTIATAKYEYELEAEFSYLFKRSGGYDHAYDPIIAAGKNACTLHYGQNSSKISSRQMVLMDVGAKVGGYAADITRTYSKGVPTKRQAQVHRAVEAAHQDIIALLVPELSVEEYMQHVDTRMKHALQELGLLKNLDDTNTYRKYFPHAISHGLGVDVHDSLGGARYLQPGMVLTVEPGVYIPEEGIGVRIEDDILITPTGHKNLSAHLSTAL